MHIPKTTTSLRNRTEILITHPLLIGLGNCWRSTTFRILGFMTWGICVKKTIGEKHSNTDYSESDFWFFLNSLPPCSDIFHLYINLFIKNSQEKKHTNWCFFRLYTQPQVLLVESKNRKRSFKKNKSSFDIMEEAISTVKNQRRTNKWTKVVYNTQGGSVNIM